MKAVNLLPRESQRGRFGGTSRGASNGLSAGLFLIVLLLVIVGLVLLRVLADNTVNNHKATLAAVETQVTQEQAQAQRLSVYTSFVTAAQQREEAVIELAAQRFAWKRSLDQLAHVLPATTSLTSLNGAPEAATTTSTTTTAAGEVFSLSGCAHTPNQNGVATLLRRLAQLTGVTGVDFQSSTRTRGCGNDFAVSLDYGGAISDSTSSTTATTTTTTPATTTATGTTGG